MEEKKYAILPCNGLDKGTGQITRETALKVQEKYPELEIICPVLLSRDENKYKESLEKKELILLDGCFTRCATKLAGEKNGKVKTKITVPDMIKETGIKAEKSLIPGNEGIKLSEKIMEKIEKEIMTEKVIEEARSEWEEKEPEYYEVMIDKFLLKVPKEGYLFSENDFWAQVRGNKAKLGVSDYFQTRAGDIMFAELPEAGKEIEQFDEVCNVESSKALLSMISPVSGRVTAVNREAEENPYLINEDPYVKGWLIEVELSDIEEDRELLMDGKTYFEGMKKKAEGEIDNIY